MGSLYRLFIHFVCLTHVQKVESCASDPLSLVRTIGVNSTWTELEFWRMSDRNLTVTKTLCWYLECDRCVVPLCQTISVPMSLVLTTQLVQVPWLIWRLATGATAGVGQENFSSYAFCACAVTWCGNLSCIVMTECKNSKGVLCSQAEYWEILTASGGNWVWHVTAFPPHLQIQKCSAGYLVKVLSHAKNIVNKLC